MLINQIKKLNAPYLVPESGVVEGVDCFVDSGGNQGHFDTYWGQLWTSLNLLTDLLTYQQIVGDGCITPRIEN